MINRLLMVIIFLTLMASPVEAIGTTKASHKYNGAVSAMHLKKCKLVTASSTHSSWLCPSGDIYNLYLVDDVYSMTITSP